MTFIEDIAALEALYGTPTEAATAKVADRLTPGYRTWIARSRFCLLSTVGPEGTDCSPRGDDGPVVTELDPRMLALPDWRGNDRIDSLRNIVRDPRVSLLFLVPGSNNVIRVNGRARVSADADLCARFARQGKVPRTVVVIEIAEVYAQCARAPLRARLWTSGDESRDLPSMGDLLREMTEGGFDGATYDAEWPGRAARTMW
ncbi:pyridoxamine 5'-phosphate oxidase family protein [Acidimangrovimonas sediminis]|uniref:pyridoxamine 5'-phosphate oxidase family protein n=1 Tax=Acidimangrovimonas sediminis TaxID=2056283 RepID=UPI000C7FA527|nr:pyridoxamine 5'-phosphate oxidase family protein [Acidimangrovimonas sediminis]